MAKRGDKTILDLTAIRKVHFEIGDLLAGWKEVAAYLRVSESFARKNRDSLLAAGVLFYRRLPTHRRGVFAWKQDLRRWSKSQSLQNDTEERTLKHRPEASPKSGKKSC
ncbi:MAG: hypothetical protein ACLP3B_22325 [Syntrophobacteraceae bacterium]